MVYNPSFTRVPSTKADVAVDSSGQVPAENTLVIYGRMTAAVQTLAFSGVAASGAFVLAFGDNDTASIDYGDSLEVIQGKIQAVSGLGSVIVSGSVASQSLVLTGPNAFPLATVPGDDNSLETADDTAVTITPTMTSTGGSAPIYVPYTVENFGDSTAVVAELSPLFGDNSEISAMVVAAINANALQANNESPVFPPIVIIPMLSTDTNITDAIAPNMNLEAPYVAIPFDASVSEVQTAFIEYLQTISGNDLGQNGQFGSFGFQATMEAIGDAAAFGTTAASQNLLIGWLPDSSEDTANTSAEIAAWLAATCAGNPAPFLPLNGVGGGGLNVPANQSDWNTPGDSGTEELGLAAGLVPLMVMANGTITISRTVTTYNTSAETPAADYYDYQDWAVLYYYRENAWTAAQNPNFTNVKASTQKIQALQAELIQLAVDFQNEGMFQNVEQLADQWTISIPEDDIYGAVYQCPVNVIPGFMNKGIGILGTTEFDSFSLT